MSIYLAFSLMATGGLVWGRTRVAGTTLVAAWYWAVGAVWGIFLAETTPFWLGAGVSGEAISAIRYSAAALSFCPVMAALGAKRPQHLAWQFVVLSLWSVLVLPAAEFLFLQRGAEFAVTGARSWFLLALIAVGVANFLPTRYGLAALLLAAGQSLLLLPHLPFGFDAEGRTIQFSGLAFCLAAIFAAAAWPQRHFQGRPIDRLWLDFRDLFGALWSLRVADRVNSAAALGDLPIGLSWSGFRSKDPEQPWEPSLEEQAAVRQIIDNLLRRFVSPEWIASRVGSADSAESAQGAHFS